ncbi:MAG: hypothetical protein SPK77_06515, partial [Lachnospiraceae bacterium]|nr:hypothetical protein [Lachnospiraceae bacterium]
MTKTIKLWQGLLITLIVAVVLVAAGLFYVSKLRDGAQQLYDGAQKLSDGSGQVADGLKSVDDGHTSLKDGLTTYTGGVATVNDGLGTLQGGLVQYTDGVSQVNNGMLQLKKSIPALSKGVKQLYNGSVSAKNGVKQYTDGVAQLYAGFPTAQKGVADYTQGIADIKAGMDAQLLTNNGKLTAGAKQVADGNEQLFETVKTQIIGGFKAFGNTADFSDNAELSDACGKFVEAVNAYLANDISAESTLKNYVPNAVDALKDPTTAQQTSIALTKLATAATLFDATYKLSVGSAQVASGVTDYTNGASAISGYLGEATKNNAALNSGMATIYGGLS